MKNTISLVLIDDNRLLREGLAGLIREQPDFQILVASADIEEALTRVREARPQVVLLDFSLADDDSLRVTSTIHQEVPEARVIVMGLLPMQEDVADLVSAGASGFIMKDATFADFIHTIRDVANGSVVLPQQLTSSLFSQITRNAVRSGKPRLLETVRLTEREQQVVALIGNGMSNKEIASHLHMSIHTVKSHVHNILEKLALHTRLEVAAFTRGPDTRSPPPRPLA